jgi:hypothetical protein
MTTEYLEKCQVLCIQMRSVLNSNMLLTEDEALWYNSALAYLRQVNRNLELGLRLSLDDAERKDDDEDDGAGSTAPNTPTPT